MNVKKFLNLKSQYFNKMHVDLSLAMICFKRQVLYYQAKMNSKGDNSIITNCAVKDDIFFKTENTTDEILLRQTMANIV